MRLSRLILLPIAFASCSSAPDRLNLILVSVDTLRADHLSCYRSDFISTPGFDRLAREGVLFENVSTVTPSTLPSHASLFTGVTPLRHGVHDNLGFRLREDLPTLASTLKQAGYRTGAFVGAFVLDGSFGLGRGFDAYSDEMPETESGLRERRAEDVLQGALGWMERESGQPFFAFLHFFDPHRPYDPPDAFEPAVPDLDARYRGEVLYVDSVLGKLLDFLDSRGLADSTALVLTADHGESLGEHGEDTHGFFLYQSTLHVPLIMRGPALPAGQRISSLARIIDVAPTVLAILGVEAPSSFEGVNLLEAGEEIRARKLEAYAQTFLPRLRYGWSELRSLRHGRWKLVLAPRPELYDLEVDPGEQRNLVAQEDQVASGLRARLLELTDAVSVRPEPPDEVTLDSLRALGYLGSPSSASSARRYDELPDPKDRLDVYKEILDLAVLAEPRAVDVERVAAVLERDPENAAALSIYAGFLLHLGRLREAIGAYQRLLEVEPESADGHAGLGKAFLDLGENEKARTSLEKARQIDPRRAIVYSRLAALEKSEGGLEASERWLREGIAITPSRVLYQELADVLIATGREAELGSIAGGWEGPGAEAAAAYARGQLLASRGNDEGALIELERASRLAPRDSNIEQAVANTLSGLGRFEEAKRRYQAILGRSPCYLGALTNLGAIEERLGKVDEAIDSYESAIRCDASYAGAYKNLGAALARKGEIRRALDVLRTARRLMPEDRELDAAIAELEGMLR